MALLPKPCCGKCSKDVYKYIKTEDNIHLNEAGIDVCANQVAQIIRKTAKELDDSFIKEQKNDEVMPGAPVLL